KGAQRADGTGAASHRPEFVRTRGPSGSGYSHERWYFLQTGCAGNVPHSRSPQRNRPLLRHSAGSQPHAKRQKEISGRRPQTLSPSAPLMAPFAFWALPFSACAAPSAFLAGSFITSPCTFLSLPAASL